MLELAEGLNDAQLDAVAGLEREVIAHDGGRLKLEWGVLRGRTGTRVDDLLWWDGHGHGDDGRGDDGRGRLIGFLGIYGFQPPTVELTGMVHPGARRQGIATALLEAALPICAERGNTTALLVTPRTPTAARDLALGRGGVLDHSEYALQLAGEPADGPSDPRVTLRPRTTSDAAVVRDLILQGFGEELPEVDENDVSAEQLRRDQAQTLMVELDGRPVGTVRLSREGDTTGVYGFVVHPDHQGRGIGRDILRRVCRQARADGAARVHLEVHVDNPRALGLYTSLGFRSVSTEDYYSLPF